MLELPAVELPVAAALEPAELEPAELEPAEPEPAEPELSVAAELGLPAEPEPAVLELPELELLPVQNLPAELELQSVHRKRLRQKLQEYHDSHHLILLVQIHQVLLQITHHLY